MRDDHVAFLVEAGAILGGSSASSEKAEEILYGLRKVVPYDAACLSTFHDFDVDHNSLVNVGYPDRVLDHLDSWLVHNDPAYLHMRKVDRRPLRWRDTSFPYRETFSAQEVFLPAGFNEGITVRLYNRLGVYTGNLHASMEDVHHPADEDVPLFVAMQTMLGGLVDRTRSFPPPVWEVDDAVNCVCFYPGPVIEGVPGRPTGPHLAEGTPLIAMLLARYAEQRLPQQFWWHSGGGVLHAITTTRWENRVLVLEEVAEPPFGLSVRELEVLTLLVEGRTNVQIATRLLISPKTVAKHVERVLHKMDVRSRTEAAVRAQRAGLVLLGA
ncbi:response regulator transcription factor [Allokutzneria sp. A3M-2-11 16]|uniref:helix-turn-helix domain-containing protein n=1 Tax=Allokutzneria sp. A3M-2-11 16 TaxID=2962043 RepID=UPI0020B8C967|nr:response regulator transcription factor [Allokutzneria sp. A3M-2-11 16]MCP3799335.1 response regulator transcription factor [Allokutzneria sp. A3M-2-11 16]